MDTHFVAEGPPPFTSIWFVEDLRLQAVEHARHTFCRVRVRLHRIDKKIEIKDKTFEHEEDIHPPTTSSTNERPSTEAGQVHELRLDV